MFGPVYEVASIKELIDKGILSKIDIRCLMLRHLSGVLKGDIDEVTGKRKSPSYHNESDYLCAHQGRNKLIGKIADKHPGVTLVMFKLVEGHGVILRDLIEKLTDKKVFFISGDTPKEEREVIRQYAQKNPCIIVCSYGTFSTGINIPGVTTIILAFPYKSIIKVLQTIGRGLRKSKNKEKLLVYDIMDDLNPIIKKDNMVLDHARRRIEIYSEKELDFQIKNKDLE